jgi:nitrite reductase (cytochrome c-552)
MRSLVCAQCHVEYYFKGEGKYLTFPWDKGYSVEELESYYDEAQFKDWVHGLSKAPMLKAQHPDYEVYLAGIHAQRGVACADCHMPYRREGGEKFTDHHIQSPLNNIANSCQVCHRESEETLRQNVFERQDKIRELRLKAEDILVRAHVEAKAAWDAGAGEDEMKNVLQLIRKAQWRWDFAAAGHGSSFHAPLEIMRILGHAIDLAQQARLELNTILIKRGVALPVAMPDISTKEKAQSYIGLDMPAFIQEKKEFLESLTGREK